jgi:hypothetical protein
MLGHLPMVTIRCTRKLLKRLGGQPSKAASHKPPVQVPFAQVPFAQEPAASTTLLGDWYANVVSLPFRGKSVAMFVNASTLLTVLIPGRGAQRLLPVFRERTLALLQKIGLPKGCIEKEAREMADLQLARTKSRSVLGSMNDMALSIQLLAERQASAEEVDWDAAEMRFAEWMHGPLEYRYPKEVAAELCQEAGRERARREE